MNRRPLATLFAVPKPFEGHIGTIQQNAIRSWARIYPPCQIVLLGDEFGVREMAEEVEAIHQPVLACNEYGTPLVGDIFQRATSVAEGELLCYVNADIILLPDLAQALARIQEYRRPFLLVGRRTDLDLETVLDFHPGWTERMVEQADLQGTMHAPTGIDYFAFRNGLFGDIPPFALGRTIWDNWLLFEARRRGGRLIDATAVVLAIHQNHDYGAAGKNGIWNGPEARMNRAFAGPPEHGLTIADATHKLTAKGLRSTLFDPPFRRKVETGSAVHPRWRWCFRLILKLMDSTYPVRKRFGAAGLGNREQLSSDDGTPRSRQ
jgi:hypothetical protein